MAKNRVPFSRSVLSILLLSSISCAYAQWLGVGPRWTYNGRETMYVGTLQTTGYEGFSFAYNWRNWPGGIEMWPDTYFKNWLWVDTPSHTPAVWLGTTEYNDGGLAVYDWLGNPTAGIDGYTGEVWGSNKSFIVPHPNDENLMIRYSSLEGPTPDMFIRGSVVLSAGQATVEFPEHFAALANPENFTFSVTPRSADSLGVAVEYSDHQNSFQIVELHQGTGEYRVDYVVHALRAGYEDYDVYLSKDDADVSITKKLSSFSRYAPRRDGSSIDKLPK